MQLRLDRTLARLAFEAGFDIDGALHDAERRAGREALKAAGIDRDRQYPIDDLEDEYAAHVRESAEGDIEIDWRSAHSIGTESLLLQAVIVWLIGPADRLPPDLLATRDSWVDAASKRATAAEALLEARQRKHRAASRMLDEQGGTGPLRFDPSLRELDPHAARVALDRVLQARSAPVLVGAVCRAADRLGLVEWSWVYDLTDWGLSDAEPLARSVCPVPHDRFEEWFERILTPRLEAWADRWGADFAGWAESAKPKEAPRQLAEDRIREVARLAASQRETAPVLMKAADVLREAAGHGLEVEVDAGRVLVSRSPEHRLEVTTTTGKRVNLQLIVDDEPVGDPVPVSVSLLRSGVAEPLLSTLRAL